MSILSDARKSGRKPAPAVKSKTDWAAGPVEAVDPISNKPMLVGLVEQEPYGTMIQSEGPFKPFRVGVDKARRVAAALAALDK